MTDPWLINGGFVALTKLHRRRVGLSFDHDFVLAGYSLWDPD